LFVGWGRFFLHHPLLADIVGETRPYNSAINLHCHCLLGGGGFFYIIHYWLILLVKPPLQFGNKSALPLFVGWGRVYLSPQLLADIVGETRPYKPEFNRFNITG
jgi:hypothetical protein